MSQNRNLPQSLEYENDQKYLKPYHLYSRSFVRILFPYAHLLPSANGWKEWIKRVPGNTGPNRAFGALGIKSSPKLGGIKMTTKKYIYTIPFMGGTVYYRIFLPINFTPKKSTYTPFWGNIPSSSHGMGHGY